MPPEYLLFAGTGILIGWLAGLLWQRNRPSSGVPSAAYEALTSAHQELQTAQAILQERLRHADTALQRQVAEIEALQTQRRGEQDQLRDRLSLEQQRLAALQERYQALEEKTAGQKEEMTRLRESFERQFELVANRLLDQKSEKFSRLHAEQLQQILKPLDEQINAFRKQVEEVYQTEARERFSLGKEVQRLMSLNQVISEEARQLTQALKGQSKTQGDWGQMILERILEQSGLEKGREYSVQEFLRGEDGRPLVNEQGHRMQPDVIVHYPDNRNVILDAKVSLTAYLRFVDADNTAAQQEAIGEHLRSVRRHIDDLSSKHYQDHAATLDFVMLFIPNEPAYLLALQQDPELWQYAYQRRILLISPTNLIAALKLITDLWKREYQNRNAQLIAGRGAALYDKFAGFVENLQHIGQHLDRTQRSYETAMNQLKEGKGNLLRQAEQLRQLGLQTKKNLPPAFRPPAEEE